MKIFLYLRLQALYFCVPFREQLIEYYSNNKSLTDPEENLLTCLADLFMQVYYLFLLLVNKNVLLLLLKNYLVVFLQTINT